MTLTERFLKYVQIETTSDENSDVCPSSPREWELANVLVA